MTNPENKLNQVRNRKSDWLLSKIRLIKVLEINMDNPIGFHEVQKLKTKLINVNTTYDFLIIDSGAHEFESIKAMKHLKDELLSIKNFLMRFNKIAMVHPQQYKNESNNPDILEYFTSKSDAKDWFLK